MNVGCWTRAFPISVHVKRTLVEVTEIGLCGDNGGHGTDIKTKQGASNDSHCGDNVDITNLVHLDGVVGRQIELGDRQQIEGFLKSLHAFTETEGLILGFLWGFIQQPSHVWGDNRPDKILDLTRILSRFHSREVTLKPPATAIRNPEVWRSRSPPRKGLRHGTIGHPGIPGDRARLLVGAFIETEALADVDP